MHASEPNRDNHMHQIIELLVLANIFLPAIVHTRHAIYVKMKNEPSDWLILVRADDVCTGQRKGSVLRRSENRTRLRTHRLLRLLTSTPCDLAVIPFAPVGCAYATHWQVMRQQPKQ